MLWIYLAIIAQFLNAAVILADKYLVASKSVSKPAVYAFYIGMLSGVVVVVAPFGAVFPPRPEIIGLSFLIAISYIFSILFLYKSLAASDASDVAPVAGSLAAVSTLIFSLVFLGTNLSSNFMIGFIFLVAGTLLMSFFRFKKQSAFYAVSAGILFGLSSVFVKIIFNNTTFIDGFFWSRMANVAGALMLLLWPANLKDVMHNIRFSTRGTKTLIIGNKGIAGTAFLLALLAINLGNVSIVNALTGAQFLFLFLFALIFTKRFPGYFFETVHHRHVIIQKLIAIILISIGLIFLFI
ncbi:MAG: EamA family transporter [Candidatus Yanofskybacteria bacterium]|nr:EamA family transporter [Candidatus Yanofskybacteria bacterium]